MFRNVMKTGIAAVITVGLALSLGSCEQTSSVVDPTDDLGTNANALFIPEPDAAPSDVSDPSLVDDLRLRRPRSDDSGRGGGGIFGELNLSDEQMEAVREALAGKKDCAKEILEALRESEREYLAEARAARQEVIEALRNGDISREEAIAALREIHADLKEALENNPDRAEAREALEGCNEAFQEAMEEILDEEQLEIWNEWVENHDRGPTHRRWRGRYDRGPRGG